MEITSLLFYLFACMLLLSGLRVITAPDSVQSALFLILAFFNAAALWMLLNAEFLAILLVLVYVGAVMVLFLFVVMMLDIEVSALRRDFRRFMPLALGIGAIMVAELGLILWRSFNHIKAAQPASAPLLQSNTHQIGLLIYTHYIFAFEIAGLVLLVAIIAAVALTLRHGKDSKRIAVSKQLEAQPKDRVRLVKNMRADSY